MISIIIGATGTISKSFRKYLSHIPEKHEVRELETTAILATAHILQKVLISKYKRFNIGNNITCSISCKYRIAEKLLETWFVQGI